MQWDLTTCLVLSVVGEGTVTTCKPTLPPPSPHTATAFDFGQHKVQELKKYNGNHRITHIYCCLWWSSRIPFGRFVQTCLSEARFWKRRPDSEIYVYSTMHFTSKCSSEREVHTNLYLGQWYRESLLETAHMVLNTGESGVIHSCRVAHAQQTASLAHDFIMGSRIGVKEMKTE